MERMSARLVFLRAALDRPWAKALLFIWAIIGFWDTVVAQLLPPEISEKAPTVYVVGHKVLSVMSGWLPWWGWALVGMALLTGLSIEYAYRTNGATLDKQSEPSDSYISLKEAATIAYEETRGTRVADIAERLSGDDNVLAYYAYALFSGTTTLYGNHPPSRKLEAIPNEERGRCGISNDLQALRRHGKNRNLYENLQIKRSDVERRISELKSAATARHEERLSDALYWIIDNSGWVSELGRDGYLDQAAIALRQAAKDGEITIRGRRELPGYEPDGQFDDTWDDIEQSYWQTHKFEMTAVMCAEPHYATRETVVVSSGDVNAEAMPHYAMLRVWNDELERLWPAANT